MYYFLLLTTAVIWYYRFYRDTELECDEPLHIVWYNRTWKSRYAIRAVILITIVVPVYFVYGNDLLSMSTAWSLAISMPKENKFRMNKQDQEVVIA